MMNLFQGVPCSGPPDYMAIINAVFNGLQMLLITWMGIGISHLSNTQDKRLARELTQDRTRK